MTDTSASTRPRSLLATPDITSVAAAAALLALAVGLVSTLSEPWVPVSDMALIELRVRDVPHHLPLLGAYSRFGWSHPGPAQFLMLAAPYRLTGGASWAIPATTLLLNITAVGIAWLIARSIDRLAGALVLLGSMALVASGGSAVLRSWWNPRVGVVLTLTLIVAAWATAERRPWPAALLLPMGSLLVQSHVGYTAVVIPVCAAGLILMVVPRSSSEPQHRRCWWYVAGGAAVAAMMWLPPVVEQLRGDPGNLTALLRSDPGPRAGIGPAMRVLSQHLAVAPPWAGGTTAQTLGELDLTWRLPVLAAIPIGAVVVALRSRSVPQLRAMGVVTAATAGALGGTAAIHGPMYTYLVPWLAPTIAALVVVSVWVLLGQYSSRDRVTVQTAASVATVVLAVVVGVQQVPHARFDPGISDAVAALAAALIDDAQGSAVFINSAPDFASAGTYGGVALAAERAGLDVRVPDHGAIAFGAHRTGPVEGRTEYLIAQPAHLDDLQDDGWQVVARHDPFTGREHEQVARLRAAADRTDPDAVQELAAVHERIAEIEQSRIAAVLLRRVTESEPGPEIEPPP